MAETFNTVGLSIVTFAALGHAYQVLQRLFTGDHKLHLLELVPSRDGAHVLLMGDIHDLRRFGELVRDEEGVTPFFIENQSEALLKALYSLETNTLGRHLVIFESQSCGELFLMGEAALGFGFQILDFKIPRGGQVFGVLILSTDESDNISNLPSFEGVGRNMTVIRERAEGFSRFFPTK